VLDFEECSTKLLRANEDLTFDKKQMKKKIEKYEIANQRLLKQ
jgi:hypothetical protein